MIMTMMMMMITFEPPHSNQALEGGCCNTGALPLNSSPSNLSPGDHHRGGNDVDDHNDFTISEQSDMVGRNVWVQETNLGKKYSSCCCC